MLAMPRGSQWDWAAQRFDRPRTVRIGVRLPARTPRDSRHTPPRQLRSRQPLRKIHHTAARQAARKPRIIAALTTTFTSDTP